MSPIWSVSSGAPPTFSVFRSSTTPPRTTRIAKPRDAARCESPAYTAARVRDFAEVRADGRITPEIAAEALEREGVDELGLDRLDRAFLRTIVEQYRGGPAGIAAIAATLTEDAETLEDVVEPFLLKEGFVTRTASGRRATALAYRHLGLTGGVPAQGRLL